MNQSKIKFPYLIAAAVACLLLCCVLLLGRAQAHFESKRDFSVTTSAQPAAHLYLQPVSDESSADWTKKKFTLSNFAFEGASGLPAMSARITVLATAGMEDPDRAQMALEKDGVVYVGRWEPIQEGTELFRSFGPGWCYLFYDADGEEPVFNFPAREQTQLPFTLSVVCSGRVSFDSMLCVRAVGQMYLGEE